MILCYTVSQYFLFLTIRQLRTSTCMFS